MSEYRPTIGLEVHAELATTTKMFCTSANDSEETEANVNVCPVCLAHPGTLPVINESAVEHVLRVGTALGSTLADYSEFDRKSYFYPDIPKGYQISQYEYPLVSGGELHGVAITRVHLEEDTARSSHLPTGKAGEGGSSLVDFNRAGVPLMELVTEPVIHDAQTAGAFARELQLLLRTLGASHANLEKGEMRIEANISVSATDIPSLAYVEVKNINSFRAVERAIEYEIKRQTALLEKGEKVIKETRGWDEDRGVTFSQRVKEGAADYRYFPEPDLPKLVLSDLSKWSTVALAASLPELPWERRARYAALGLAKETIVTLGNDIVRATYFDTLINELASDTALVLLAANYLANDVGEGVPPSVERFAELVRLIAGGTLSSRAAKDVLKVLMIETEGSAHDIASREGLLQESDPDALRKVVHNLLAEYPAVVAEYRAGKESVLQFLVGHSMKASRGAGNPGLIRDLLVEELSKKD